MPTVFVTHPSDKLDSYFGADALRRLQQIAVVRLNSAPRDLSLQELIAAARHCDVLIAYRQTPGPEALFSAWPRLAAFLRCAVDIRSVDVAAASAHGVLVTQASAGYVAAVSEWVIAVMVDLARGISRYARGFHEEAPLPGHLGRELRGASIGVIGFGQIGRYTAGLARAFGMRVLVNTPEPVADDPMLAQVDLAVLLAGSDFVVCLAAATAQTENLMDARAFATMKPGAYFINASRGELVDEDALLAALDGGRLAGCALDVGRAPDQMPSPRLARHPLVLATPHIGGLTSPSIEHQALETVAQLGSLIGGQFPVGAVNAASALRLRNWNNWH